MMKNTSKGNDIDEVIKILKKSRQSLVFLNSKICPVRDYVGESYRDMRMKWIIDNLKDMGIIDVQLGFMSLSNRIPFFYADAIYLEEGFEYNKPAVQQKLKL